jgi:hypothetical protein
LKQETFNMISNLSAGISTAALIITIVVPLYCLIMTPGDTLAVYGLLHTLFGDGVPPISLTVGGMPKVIYVLGWLLFSIAQMGACFLLQPRWWISGMQFTAAIFLVLLIAFWHVCLVHLPMVKLFNDLS